MGKDHSARFEAIRLNIVYYRKKKKMTQQQLADRLNVSRGHISRIEAPGTKDCPSFDLLFDIADILEIPVEKFFEIR